MNRTDTVAVAPRKLFAAATALLVASVLVVNGLPNTASAASPVSAEPTGRTLHDSIDWSRVAAAPVDTGATVGAYDR
jgi:hypothetical protein